MAVLYFLLNALLLAVPLARLMRRVGRSPAWAVLAFVPVAGGLLSALAFGAGRWPNRPDSPAMARERRALLVAAFTLLPLCAVVAAVAGARMALVLYHGATPDPAGGLGPRDVFFRDLTLALAAGSALLLVWGWALWRAARLACRRTGHSGVWAIYMLVPGIQVMLPWILAARVWPAVAAPAARPSMEAPPTPVEAPTPVGAPEAPVEEAPPPVEEAPPPPAAPEEGREGR